MAALRASSALDRPATTREAPSLTAPPGTQRARRCVIFLRAGRARRTSCVRIRPVSLGRWLRSGSEGPARDRPRMTGGSAAVYAMSGPGAAWRFITGQATTPMCELGWKSLGVLELTALPSIDEDRQVCCREARARPGIPIPLSSRVPLCLILRRAALTTDPGNPLRRHHGRTLPRPLETVTLWESGCPPLQCVLRAAAAGARTGASPGARQRADHPGPPRRMPVSSVTQASPVRADLPSQPARQLCIHYA